MNGEVKHGANRITHPYTSQAISAPSTQLARTKARISK